MRRIILLNAALFAALQLYSQNLNPQVQVTNDYQTRMADVSKLELQMQVPDSLGEFATDVDYSVFQTDYKGAYEFNPYAIKVTPKAGDYSGRRLYLRAGAGFSFHPVLNAVYTPVRKGLHRMNFYNEFNGYAGRYHQAVGDSFNGYDYSERLGAEGRLNDEDFDLRWNAAWKGNFNKDSFTRSIYNGVNLSTNISSNSDTTQLYYNFSMKAGFATDRFSNGALGRVNEFSYIVDGTIGPEIYHHMIRLLIDIHTQCRLRLGSPQCERGSFPLHGRQGPRALPRRAGFPHALERCPQCLRRLRRRSVRGELFRIERKGFMGEFRIPS